MSEYIFPWYIRLWRKLTPWIKRDPVRGHGVAGNCGVQQTVYNDFDPNAYKTSIYAWMKECDKADAK